MGVVQWAADFFFFFMSGNFPRQGPSDPSGGWRHRLVGEGGGKGLGVWEREVKGPMVSSGASAL